MRAELQNKMGNDKTKSSNHNNSNLWLVSGLILQNYNTSSCSIIPVCTTSGHSLIDPLVLTQNMQIVCYLCNTICVINEQNKLTMCQQTNRKMQL